VEDDRSFCERLQSHADFATELWNDLLLGLEECRNEKAGKEGEEKYRPL
jgi:hypothetical protein